MLARCLSTSHSDDGCLSKGFDLHNFYGLPTSLGPTRAVCNSRLILCDLPRNSLRSYLNMPLWNAVCDFMAKCLSCAMVFQAAHPAPGSLLTSALLASGMLLREMLSTDYGCNGPQGRHQKHGRQVYLDYARLSIFCATS